MDKERLKQLAERPEFIPGIYNYCDRWCARCSFTARCMNYAMRQEHFPEPPSRDLGDTEFWDRMKETFDATLGLLQELADKAGIEIDDTFGTDDDAQQRDEEAHEHGLAHASRAYAARVEAWFEQAKTSFARKNETLVHEAELVLPGVEDEATALQDALDVIQWYRQQIHVKLIRALRDHLAEPFDPLAGLTSDADGSAKVALLGMDHSIDAWHTLYDHFPEQEDEILPLLVLLQRLRRETEKTFPDARAFVRPGFDDVP